MNKAFSAEILDEDIMYTKIAEVFYSLKRSLLLIYNKLILFSNQACNLMYKLVQKCVLSKK